MEVRDFLLEKLANRIEHLEHQMAMQGRINADERLRVDSLTSALHADVAGRVSSAETETLTQWGEMEMLANRLDKLERGFEDLTNSFNQVVTTLSRDLTAIKDVLVGLN